MYFPAERKIMNTIQIAGETLITPKELAKAGVIGITQQCELRKAGKLKCYRNGIKVLYSWEKHIEPYLETNGQTSQMDNENAEGITSQI